MQIVDTHCHLIYRDRLRYPWLAADPLLNRDCTVEDYLPQARAAGITDVLHMEVDVDPADIEAEAVFTGALGAPFVGTIAGCRPEHAAFPAQLERLAAIAGVKGLRRILHTQPDGLAQTRLFADNLGRLARFALSFDLCVLPRQIPTAIALARACPDVQFVLDHCGVPDVKARAMEPWRAGVAAIAALPNVAAKLSGIVAYAAPDTWTVDDLRPYAEFVIERFGWDRVMWGSDHPVCTRAASLGRWMAATHALLQGASESEKARLLGLNARRIYRLGEGRAVSISS